MRMKHGGQYRIVLRVIFGVLLATSLFSAAANAHPTFAGKFTLPYEVHWGQAVLPAGDYYIRMSATQPLAVITSVSGNMGVFTQAPKVADSEPGGRCLTITNLGNERRVRSLNLPEIGKIIIFAPLSKNEREILAKAGQVSTVPVVTAKK